MSKKEFFIILSITFFVVMVWIIADIIHTKPSVQLDPKIQELLEPTNPVYDLDTIKKVDDNFANLGNIPRFATPQPETSSLPSLELLDDLSSTESSTLDDQINRL